MEPELIVRGPSYSDYLVRVTAAVTLCHVCPPTVGEATVVSHQCLAQVCSRSNKELNSSAPVQSVSLCTVQQQQSLLHCLCSAGKTDCR